MYWHSSPHPYSLSYPPVIFKPRKTELYHNRCSRGANVLKPRTVLLPINTKYLMKSPLKSYDWAKFYWITEALRVRLALINSEVDARVHYTLYLQLCNNI